MSSFFFRISEIHHDPLYDPRGNNICASAASKGSARAAGRQRAQRAGRAQRGSGESHRCLGAHLIVCSASLARSAAQSRQLHPARRLSSCAGIRVVPHLHHACLPHTLLDVCPRTLRRRLLNALHNSVLSFACVASFSGSVAILRFQAVRTFSEVSWFVAQQSDLRPLCM